MRSTTKTIGTSALYLLAVLLLATGASAMDTTTTLAWTVVMMSLIAFCAKLGLALWVYLKNPSANVNRYFCIVFIGQAVWDLGKYVMWQLKDPVAAEVWGKISYAGYVLSVFLFMQFIWAYLKKKNILNRTKAGKIFFYLVVLAMLAITLGTDLMIKDVVVRPMLATAELPLWIYDYGPVYNTFFLWFQMLPFLYGLVLFGKKYFTTKRIDKKKQVLYVMIGSSFPIIIGIPTGVILPAMGIILPPHNNLLTLIMSVFITIGIAKYKFLAIEPASERSPERPLPKNIQEQYKLDKGKSYLLTREDSLDISYRVVLSHLRKRQYGLIITHKNPTALKVQFGIDTTPIVWVTEADTDHLSVDPVDVEQLYQTIKLFCSRVGNPYILFDGLKYLMLHNNFSKILHLIREVKNVVEAAGGVLVIPEGKVQLPQNQERVMESQFITLPHTKGQVSRDLVVERVTRRRDYKHIILGFTPVTESLIEELEKENIRPTVITTENIHHHIPPGRITVIKGDPLSKKMLQKAGVGKPGTIVIVTMGRDSEAILAINKVRQLTDTGVVVTHIDNREYMEIAEKAGADHVVPSSSIGGQLMSLTLCAPNAVRWIMDSTTLTNRDIELVDVTLTGKDRFSGKTVMAADNELGRIANIIAVENAEGLQKIPDDSYILKEGDKLVLVANLGLIKKRKPDEIRKALLSKQIPKKHK